MHARRREQAVAGGDGLGPAAAGPGGGMGGADVVERARERGGGAEAVVEEGAFEEGVDEGVEGVPDEEDPRLRRGAGGGEESVREERGGAEDGEGREEGEDGGAVDGGAGGWRGERSGGRHCRCWFGSGGGGRRVLDTGGCSERDGHMTGEVL